MALTLSVASVLCWILSFSEAYMTTNLASTYNHVATERGAAHVITEARHLYKRRDQCDPSYFFCPTGTCFTDPSNGYVGCCAASSCAPRTLCLDYMSDYPKGYYPCDTTTGGCLYCSDSMNPRCFVLTNVAANQWIQYCATVGSTSTISYDNTLPTGSQWYKDAQATPTATASPSQTITVVSSSLGSGSQNTIAFSSKITSDNTASTLSATAVESVSLTSSASVLPASAVDTLQSTAIEQPRSSVNPGLIGGTVGGGIAVLTLIATCLCLWRRKQRARKSDSAIQTYQSISTEKDSTPASSHSPVLPPKDKNASQYFSPAGFSQFQEADSKPVTTATTPSELPANMGLGIVPAAGHYSLQSFAPLGQAESSSFVSPLIGSPAPTSHGSASVTSNATPQASLVSPINRQHVFELPYSPSIYAEEPPGSIQRPLGTRPLSLPQQYSASRFLRHQISNAQIRTPSQEQSVTQREDAEAPWQYLSPEEALNGGWRNDRPIAHSPLMSD